MKGAIKNATVTRESDGSKNLFKNRSKILLLFIPQNKHKQSNGLLKQAYYAKM